MKRLLCLLTILCVLFPLTACHVSNRKPDTEISMPSGYLSASCSKDGVEELLSIIGEKDLGGLSTGMKTDAAHCYNVTPRSVAAATDIRIFKFSDSCLSLALIDNEVYEICTSFGGYGFVNAEPWDYDGDGNPDLLIASSWGSGLHRSEISVFNTKTKESILIYDTAATDNPSVDLFVAASSPSFSSKDPGDPSVSYVVYSANITVQNDNLANLTYAATDVVGSVVLENGTPVFKAYDPNAVFTKTENRNLVSASGTEYALLATEDVLYYLGDLEFQGSVEGEERVSYAMGVLPYQTGLYAIKNTDTDNILVRHAPDNEWFSIYRKASLPPFDFSVDNCTRLELILGIDYIKKDGFHTTYGDGIRDKAEIADFLSDVRSQANPEDAGLYELVKKPDGMWENCYLYAVIYGFFEEEPNVAIRMNITSYNDLAYSVSIEDKEYVLPEAWLRRLQNS